MTSRIATWLLRSAAAASAMAAGALVGGATGSRVHDYDDDHQYHRNEDGADRKASNGDHLRDASDGSAALHCPDVTRMPAATHRNDRLVHLAALALSDEVVKRTLNDREVHAALGRFGLRVLKHPDMVATLKAFFKSELTGDTRSRRELQRFVVQDVLLDSWVRDELLDVVRETCATVRGDAAVYPRAVMQWLLDGVTRAVHEPAGQALLWDAAYAVAWQALTGTSATRSAS